MATKAAILPQISMPWVDSQGRPTEQFRNFMIALAANKVGPLTTAPNDAAAATAGVAIGQLYQSSGSVRIRVS